MSVVPGAPWLHPAVTIAASSIAGRGLFAIEPIRRDVVVWRLGGRVVPRAEFDALVAAAAGDPAAAYVDGITLSADTDLLLPTGSPPHFGNHSCEPNVWWTDPIGVATRRDIEAGEELTPDYATSTDHPDFRMACTCGAPSCRRFVTGNDWRLPELHDRYGEHWIPWLLHRIRQG